MRNIYLPMILSCVLVISGCDEPLKERVTITVDGVEREFDYVVDVESDYFDSPVPLPVIIDFHGDTPKSFGDTIDFYQKYASRFVDPDILPSNTIIITPSGLPRFYSNEQVYVSWRSEPESTDIKFFDAILEKLAEPKPVGGGNISHYFPVDFDRIYVSGMSSGAVMSWRLACSRSDKIAAIAVVAGGSMPNKCVARPVPVIMFHGTEDQHVGYRYAEDAYNYWTANYDSQETNTYSNGDTSCKQRELFSPLGGVLSAAELCISEGAGHTWPGNEDIVGFVDSLNALTGKNYNVSLDIDATDRIFNFFDKYKRWNTGGLITEDNVSLDIDTTDRIDSVLDFLDKYLTEGQ